MTIVGTPVASASLGNTSYITTTADLETRIGDDPRTAAIALKAASTATQTWYLQRATRNIDQLPFIGYKYASDQALQHPRKFITNPETDNPWGETLSVDAYGYHYDSAVPEVVKAAAVEEAIALYDRYSIAGVDESDLKAKGITSYSLGKLSFSFGAGSAHQYGSLQSKEAYDMLLESGYIELAPLIQ